MQRMVCEAMGDTATKSEPGPHLGLRIASLTAALARQHGVPDTVGVVVRAVTECGPGDLAGIESGDLIRRFNGQTVASAPDLVAMVRSAGPGATVTLGLLRDGRSMNVQVALGGNPPSAGASNPTGGPPIGAQSDWLIVPGNRMGPVTLGTTGPTDAARVLGEPSKCGGLVNGGTGCDFPRWGLEIDFADDSSSPGTFRRANVVVASPDEGDAAMRFATDRGVRIGSSEQDVLHAYGTPSDRVRLSNGGSYLDYDVGIGFDLTDRDHIVQSIRVFAPVQ